MNIQQKLVKFSFLFVTCILGSCGFIELYEPDSTAPEVRISYPETGAVISPGGAQIQIEVSDNEVVSRLELYVQDELHVTLEAEINSTSIMTINLPDNEALTGKYLKIYVKAFDARENEAISNFLYINHVYELGHLDSYEEEQVDITQVLIRSTENRVDLRISAFEAWDIYDDSTGLHTGIFLDVDQNNETGFQQVSLRDSARIFLPGLAYELDSLGADFLVTLGFEGNALYSWDTPDSSWKHVAEIECSCLDDTNSVDLSINLDQIGSPSVLRFRVANIIHYSTGPIFDWAPNEGNINYIVNGMYLE